MVKLRGGVETHSMITPTEISPASPGSPGSRWSRELPIEHCKWWWWRADASEYTALVWVTCWNNNRLTLRQRLMARVMCASEGPAPWAGYERHPDEMGGGWWSRATPPEYSPNEKLRDTAPSGGAPDPKL